MNAVVLALALAAAPALSKASAELDAEVSLVIDLFYNLEFEKAAKAADALAAAHPGHPVGPFYHSIVFYQKFLSEEPKSPETLREFERHAEAALEAAERLIDSDRAQGHYYLGITKGFRARVLAARRRYIRAIPEGLSAVRQLKKALAIDPELEDAYLGLGMYHYFSARIPSGAKPFAYLIGAGWGDREKGLEYLHRAADRGGPARMEARSILSSVYTLEGHWQKADAFLAELTERYPRNPLYRLRRVYVNQRAGWWDKALRLSDPHGAWLEGLPKGIKELAQPPALYRAAETLILTGRADKAELLLATLQKLPSTPALRDFAAIRQGNMLDLAGRRSEALRLYEQVRHRAARRLAERFLTTPFSPQSPREVMPWLGLETPS